MMKMKKILSIAALTAAAATGASAFGFHHGHFKSGFNRSVYPNHSKNVQNAATISDKTKENLSFMREEEKLARDVYITLYNKWHLRVFANIAKSEQRHMDAVKRLLGIYHVKDPVVSDKVGVFSNKELASLYKELVEKGSLSPVSALKVGALIEDKDIKDIEDVIAETDSPLVKRVLTNLKAGSTNHMRAFARSLKSYGETYTPSFISESEYLEVLSGSKLK